MRRIPYRDILRSALVAVILALFVRTFLVQAFAIPSDSMAPGLLAGDQILVNKFTFTRWGGASPPYLPMRPVHREDLVVFQFPRAPRRDLVKRCVALPGDLVEIRDKQLYLNGEVVEESGYVQFTDPRTYPRTLLLPDAFHRRDNLGPLEVAPRELFCLGDNRDISYDSRFWGGVPLSFVKGRPLLIYWSLRPLPKREEAAGDWAAVRRAWRLLVTLPDRIRWHRLFQPVS